VGAARRAIAHLILPGPALLFLAVVFAWPVGEFLSLAFADPAGPMASFQHLASEPVYRLVLWRTIVNSLAVVLVVLAAAFPLAFVIAHGPRLLSRLLLFVVTVSFWTSFVVKSYAWIIVLGNRGPLAGLFSAFGFEPLRILFTTTAAVIGMAHVLVPYAVLVLVPPLLKIDRRLLMAAHGLGASRWQTFRAIVLPLAAPGLSAAALLSFALSLGYYITPALLGTPREMMIAQLIAQQIEELLEWRMAAALSLVLLAVTVVLTAFYRMASARAGGEA
jgi:putative spermidine/putrescine transport system permease protein